MVTIKLPSALKPLAGGRAAIEVPAGKLSEALQNMDKAAPMIRPQLFDTSGRVRQFVGLFVHGRQIEDIVANDPLLTEGDEVVVVMAVAGG